MDAMFAVHNFYVRMNIGTLADRGLQHCYGVMDPCYFF